MKEKFGPFLRNDGDSKGLEFLEGAVIEQVGITKTGTYTGTIATGQKRYIEGGLSMIVNKDGKRERVILGYTELGLWLEARLNIK